MSHMIHVALAIRTESLYHTVNLEAISKLDESDADIVIFQLVDVIIERRGVVRMAVRVNLARAVTIQSCVAASRDLSNQAEIHNFEGRQIWRDHNVVVFEVAMDVIGRVEAANGCNQLKTPTFESLGWGQSIKIGVHRDRRELFHHQVMFALCWCCRH